MGYLGGGESLCCETMSALLTSGHELSLLTETFSPVKIEERFGLKGLFESIGLIMYSPCVKSSELGNSSHLIHHIREQKRLLKMTTHTQDQKFDLVFSTQDEGYIPDANVPIVQWGYYPRYFPRYFTRQTPRSLPKELRVLPVRLHYRERISRIGLVLAISEYSKMLLDKEWERPSALVYPPCEMIPSRPKRNFVVTAARADPGKKLDLFWQAAKSRPQYEFVMLLTRSPHNEAYSKELVRLCPANGRVMLNASKDEYRRILGEAKVYIHLMKEERFGITIVEAMSAECVPIVYDSGAPTEFVDSEVGFRWHDLGDIPTRIDEAMKISPSTAARVRAESFTRERFVKRLSSVFSELQVRNPKLGR